MNDRFSRWPIATLRIAICLLTIFLIQLDSSQSHAQKVNAWPFFRGGNYDGHSQETGIVDQWSDKGPPILWTRGLGSGYSSFVGENDRVFTQYQSLSGQFVVCLDARSGKTIWEHRYAWPYQPASLYPGPRSTPTLSAGRVYFTTPTGKVGCLEADSGQPVWIVDTVERFGAEAVEFGYACSPVCVDGKVILPVGGADASMVALDQGNGSTIWQAGNQAISYCSAFPIEFGARKLVVGYFKNSLCVIDRESGTQLLTVQISSGYDEHSAWPVYREPFLWASGPFRAGSQLFKFVDDAGNLKLNSVYRTQTMSNDVASSVLVGDALYGFDIRDVQSKVQRPSRGQFICQDFMTGETQWTNGTFARRTLEVEEFVTSRGAVDESDIGHASVIYADGKLILFNDTGELILCQANAESFVPLSRAQVLGGQITWAPPALMNGCVFLRNHSKAVCVYLGDIDKLDVPKESIRFASEINQPTFFDLSAAILGTEPTYAMTSPKASWLLNWYLISLGLGWVAAPCLAMVVARWTRIPKRVLFLGLAFAVGLFGTTVFGHGLKQFYFSWPIVLLLAFECVVCQLKSSDPTVEAKPWRARLSLVFFAFVCFAYFWLGRRLSLAFEWSFLMGFPLALPFLWIVKRSVQAKNEFGFRQWLGSAAGFTAFYWAGAGIMIWKYSVG